MVSYQDTMQILSIVLDHLLLISPNSMGKYEPIWDIHLGRRRSSGSN